MSNKEFAKYVVQDVLSGVSGVTARAMFGGHGLYRNGVIFGIIIDGDVYFKVDDVLQKKYEEMGSKPFTYERDGKVCSMRYWIVPSNILAEREEIIQWVAWSCALSSPKKTSHKK